MKIEIIPLIDLPMIKKNDDLSQLILSAIKKQGMEFQDRDVLVLCHVIVSKSEGRMIDLKTVIPSKASINFAEYTGKDPRLIEVVLGESRAVRRMGPGVLIT